MGQPRRFGTRQLCAGGRGLTTATKSSLHPETAQPKEAAHMKTLYLIRHAQSAANAGGTSLLDREISLSAKGAQQAAELACRLPANRRVFVSNMRRTHETAAPYCARHGIRPEILSCLNEFSYLPFAAVQGLDAADRKPLAEAYWQRADPHFRAGGGADTFAEFDGRVSDFLHRAWPSLPHGSLLFGHGIWIALLAWWLSGNYAETGADMAAFRAFQSSLHVANASVWRLDGTETAAESLRCLPENAAEF